MRRREEKSRQQKKQQEVAKKRRRNRKKTCGEKAIGIGDVYFVLCHPILSHTLLARIALPPKASIFKTHHLGGFVGPDNCFVNLKLCWRSRYFQRARKGR
jgi:hypothetical protein